MRLQVLVAASMTLVAILALTGCTQLQLRRYTVGQMSTVHELQQQQVLNNLAMFVHNRDAYPYFSVVTQGTATLQDTGTLDVTNAWGLTAAGAFIYNALGVNPSFSRQQTGAWVINPVNDSIKLTVMRCVYRRAVDGCLGTTPEGCPACDKLFYAYYNMLPDQPWDESLPYPSGPNNNPLDPANQTQFNGVKIAGVSLNDDGSQTITGVVSSTSKNQFQGATITIEGANGIERRLVASSASETDQQKTELVVCPPFQAHLKSGVDTFDLAQHNRLPIRGIATPECLSFGRNWFCCGTKPPAQGSKCNLVGHYCGTYVWVPPSGVDELTKVTMLIQDIAFYNPPQAGQQITATNFSQNGGGGGAGATQVMTTVVPLPRQQTIYPYSGVLGFDQILQTGRAGR